MIMSTTAPESPAPAASPAAPRRLARLSVVVPVYKEEGNIPVFLERVRPILLEVADDHEVIFALDPSPDRSEAIIDAARAKDPRVKLLTFSRRVGQPMATLAGLKYSKGDAVVVMDVDLQDPPELIREMVSKHLEGWDAVAAQRRNRAGETLFKRLISWVGYKIINKIASVEIPPNTGDFRLLSRRIVDALNDLKESHGFLRGLVALVGFSQTTILFDRPARHSGFGNYNRFLGSLRIGMNGLVCFSNYLLSLSTVMGFVVAGGSFLFAVLYGLLWCFGFPFPMGNPTIVILILFMGGIQLISIGILGEYVGRIYEEVKDRPKFIVARAEGFAGAPVGTAPARRTSERLFPSSAERA